MKINRQIIILGTGENAQVIKNIFVLNSRKNILFLDDNKKLITKSKDVIGPLSDINTFPSDKYDFFVSIGNNKLRKKWFDKLVQQKKNIINAIHPQAFFESSVKFGKNIMLGANTYININSKINDNVIINNGCIIEHDNIIEKHTQIGPGVVTGGKVIIKENSFIGLGSKIIDHIIINKNNIIGAGSVVVKNTDENSMYLGIPAKKVKKL